MSFSCFRRFLFFLLLPVLCGFFPPLLSGQNISDITGDTLEETAGSGLVIRTKPIGARVFIDGIERGQSPLVMNNLKEGEYYIRLVKEGYRERRFKITLSASSRLVVSIELETAAGQVLFRFRKAEGSPPEEQLPLRPVIIADGETAAVRPEFGETPVLSLPVGYRTIQVRAFGWMEAVKTVYVREGELSTAVFTMSPAPFTMSRGTVSRPRFNPANSGSLGLTEFRFEVSAPGRGVLTIKDQAEQVVYRAVLGPFRTWSQSISWNGREAGGAPLPEGRYRAFIETEALPWDGSAPAAQSLVLETEINSSLIIYPLSFQGILAGLLFAPAPVTLPSGSFQIEANLFFGGTAPGERAFSTLPFDVGIRFSPLNRLEITALLNALPRFDGAAALGGGGSLKYVLLHSGEGRLPLGLAAGISYAWAENGAAPIGPGTGMGFYCPLSWRFDPLTLIFSPGIQWPIPHDLVTRPILSGGLHYQGAHFTAGFSLRQEFNVTRDPGSGRDARNRSPLFLQAGGELKWYPPPSNLVFTLSGGLWHNGSQTGGFGGLG
ncbi:MAG: PEGA domain-containing protein, partial [Treponema sp.]|nr:PEGA domain-containing protein [Treponema sp.]